MTGVEPYSQADFDARDIDELINPPQTYAVSVDESVVEYNSNTAQESSQVNTTTIEAASSKAGDVKSEELAKEYAVYEPFGLTYDKKQDYMYYNGKLVRQFIDILSSNGEALTDGKFKGSMRLMNSPDGKGEVDVYTVRDYGTLDADGNGTLTDIKAYSQEEFDAQTKNVNIYESDNTLGVSTALN